MSIVRRLFVEKKQGYDVLSKGLLGDLKENLGLAELTGVRIVIRYDIEGIAQADYAAARETIFAEPPVDFLYDEQMPARSGERIFAIEYLPGQYDQRADSAAQCIQILTQGRRPMVATARVIALAGSVSDEEFESVKKYLINPVDSREASLVKRTTLDTRSELPPDVQVMTGFISLDTEGLETMRGELGLAMRREDLAFCGEYFRNIERRDPTLTEIRVLDTYWSDHCRHTTFLTHLDNIEIVPGRFNEPLRAALKQYTEVRELVYDGHSERKPVCLMDIATIGMKELKGRGMLDDLDQSEEINACSIAVPVEIDGRTEEWLLMFKNETHNHPTEIEPFGGAATCLGGAIRDPLSGRSYVYHAMRVTGAADPRTPVHETLAGKLPQRKLTTLAAHGYSSYGNQIGLATGLVSEIYDQGYVAKRMEIGAVVGAAPKSNVVRQAPAPGDLVVLLGGRTGRDGCGGATGSSKEHTEESIQTCSAEVQKGNPPTERKIQRLFRNPDVSRMIKRCNDFGAGGVSVAIGELAPGLEIDLDAVPRKYDGLDGTELAISESQERMAVVISPENYEKFAREASAENLETALVARVRAEPRLKMSWRGKTIVDISRDFIDTNGVRQHARATISAPDEKNGFFAKQAAAVGSGSPGLDQAWYALMEDLNVCSQQGLVERFDSTIGAGSVLLPFGGKYQATPIQSMVAKIPVRSGETITGSVMSWGFDPGLSRWSPFHGAVFAVVEAVSKVVAAGGDSHAVRLTLQEYFEKPGNDSERWGKPLAALLGAFRAQMSLGIAAIGGKDSMSGTFKDLTVPPTLVAFAVSLIDVRTVVSPEFKEPGDTVVFVPLIRDTQEMPDFGEVDKVYISVHQAITRGLVRAAYVVRRCGIAEAVAKMAFGNRIGLDIGNDIDTKELFAPQIGSFVLELAPGTDAKEFPGALRFTVLGKTSAAPRITVRGVRLPLDNLKKHWDEPLSRVFPAQCKKSEPLAEFTPFTSRLPRHATITAAKPRALITVFPGTNCEYDSARAFEKAGGVADILVIRNLTPSDIGESIDRMVRAIANSQIVMLPGGFSAGDEPDGSGKFIAAFFRNPRIRDAVERFLKVSDGLMLGICNGFQAMIKLGLVPWGEIRDMTPQSPTLTFNTIGRHISRMAYTRVTSVQSPWLANAEVGEVHVIPISHGEGRFVASRGIIDSLVAAGQVATRYVDTDGRLSEEFDGNLNGSYYAIEGISSPDGRVLGKMGHSERKGENVSRNISGKKDQLIFEAGVGYFR